MNEKTEKLKFTCLRLVYPPLSNQEAEWLTSDPEVEEILRNSDFYMIGARAEANFENITFDEEEGTIDFEFTVPEIGSEPVQISIKELPDLEDRDWDSVEIEVGPKFIRLWDKSEIEHPRLVDWFTTEKLLWDKARGRSGISGLKRLEDFVMYDLLYVGIAKRGDTYDRLFSKAHHARQKILGNEHQRKLGARVTDEMMLFAFRIEPLFLTTFGFDHDFSEQDFELSYNHKAIVADAEKAFVSLLDPEYNVTKFKSYPKGKDGVYGGDYNRYAYALCELLRLRTGKGIFNGDFDKETQLLGPRADAIFIEGDEVSWITPEE